MNNGTDLAQGLIEQNAVANWILGVWAVAAVLVVVAIVLIITNKGDK